MRKAMIRYMAVLAAAMCAVLVVFTAGGRAQAQIKCDPDNGGLKLPAGFCAAVVAENNPTARHLVVAPNGDVYVARQGGGGGRRGGTPIPSGVVALRDKDGDGKLETREEFGMGSTTGIGLRNGYLYIAHFNTV